MDVCPQIVEWGNPYPLSRYTRQEAVAAYRVWVSEKIASGKLDITELRGKDLVCWCAPADCHADILIELANTDRFWGQSPGSGFDNQLPIL